MSTENLINQEAIDKLREMVDGIDIGMLGTYSHNNPFIHAVPMSRQEIDEQGTIWFLFSSSSETFTHLQADSRVSLLYADIKGYNFLSVNGVATISKDPARIEKYWNKWVEAWFEKGKEDPHIRVLQVKPVEAHYWDNKTNKLVSLVKLAASALTGAKLDIGRQGNLSL
ncbi:pyridoxamine 5'-phosphate oxidase family protein [Flavihumibacter sp. CACIAM 22H1]|uniref:pyridoxamine 5'-phosphate oxidase family protein n=1 Tax=Flavihumibacter sp. CACIAM 22H1 TaxID=1812911 RepID=UPI000A82FDD3|nr:pyridoxamine 5'-phosphate oxidase family protein [Flavihumibacter sp. CACIAM 22H1]